MGEPTPRPSRETMSDESLPPRPRQIAELRAQGHSRGEIADQLGIRTSTVKAHIELSTKIGRVVPALTPRELQIAKLLATGHHAGDIAQMVGIASRTVSNYRVLIMATLGIRTVVELTHYAILQGWVAPGDALAPEVRERAARPYQRTPDPRDSRIDDQPISDDIAGPDR